MPASPTFVRDRLTWFAYWLIGAWAFFLYFIGPATTAIGDDLDLPDAAVGFIGTALALGLATSAIVGPRLVARWGRIATVRAVLVAMAGCSVVLAAAGAYPVVLLAVAALGLLGAILANTATALLSDRHGEQRARAITEGNATAAWLGVASPAVLGAFLAMPAGWRGAALLVGLLPLVLVGVLRLVRPAPSEPTPAPVAAPQGGDAGTPHALPWRFWPALITVAMAVALEFTVNFWAAALISQRTGAVLAAAATALSALTLALALGRTFGGGLTNRFPVRRLLILFFCLAALGLAVLLAAPTFAWSVVGLFVTGLGLSVLFPFAQAQAVALARADADRAVGLTALGAGAAIGAAPFLLGVLAGFLGLERAFAAGFLLAAAGVAATVLVGLPDRAGQDAAAGPSGH